MNTRLLVRPLGRHVLLIILLGFLLAPTVIMVSTSFKPYSEVNTWPPQLIPDEATVSSFTAVLIDPAYDFGRAFLNSSIIAVGTAVVSVVLGLPAAYAIRRFTFTGRTVFLFAVLVTQMVSPALFIMPLYQVMNGLGLLNTYIALIIGNSAITLPVVIWLLSAYLRGVPIVLEEAAMVDGASRLSALIRVVLPISAPGILAAGAYAFVHAWNDLVFALAFVTNTNMHPITRALDRFAAENVVRWDLTMAASTLSVIPILLLFILLQRHLLHGVAVGAIKE
jgi:ABC-type glycerol-3-phosphate transport system permease component